MATFELQGPDGGTYQVDAPDAASAVAALHGGPQQPPAAPFDETQYRSPDESSEGPSRSFATDARAFTSGLPLADQAAALGRTYLPTALGGNDQNYSQNLADVRGADAAAQQEAPLAAVAGKTAGLAPLMALPGGAAAGAGIGAFQGAADSDWSDPVTAARNTLAGGFLGGTVGAAAPAVAGAVGKAISPFSIPPERQMLVDALRGANVPVSAGQAVGSRGLQALEAAGVGGKGAATDQGKAFTQAIMDQGGIPAASASQSSIRDAKAAIGKMFADLGERNTLMIDGELGQEVQNAVSNYKRLGGSSPGVEGAADSLLARNNPAIEGDTYNAMRSGLGKDAQSLRKSDHTQAQAYRDIQGALDDAMERSIAKNNPDDLGAFREARRVYGNFQDVSRAASKLKGEDRVAGTIPPSRMQTVLSSGNKAANYAAGEGDLAALTGAGAGILTPPRVQGGILNPFSRHALLHALGAAGAGPLVRAPFMQRYLQNQAGAGAATSPAVSKISALAAALAGNAALQGR